MNSKKSVVLYRNKQWMIIKEPRDIYLVEIDRDYPDDLDGGYSISVPSLATASASGHTEIFAICEKSWVNVDDLQDATERAFVLARVRPNYDVAKAFADARRYYARPRGGMRSGASA